MQLAAAGFVLGAVLFSVSEQSRAQAYVVLPAVIGVCAGLLGLVLGAIAIVTAFMTRGFVAAVDDIDEVLMLFRTVAAVAAGGIGVALLGLVIQEPAIWQLVVAALSLSSALAVWTVGGVVQLVGRSCCSPASGPTRSAPCSRPRRSGAAAARSSDRKCFAAR